MARARAEQRRTAKQIVKGYERAEGEAQLWRHLWRLCYRYTMPHRDVVDKRSSGQYQGQYIFDSTGSDAAHNGISRLMQNLFPPDSDWIKLNPGAATPEAVKHQAATILDQASAIWHSLMKRSNFSTAGNEGLYDLYVGTMALLFEEGDLVDPFVFHSVPTPMIAVEPGPNGQWRAIYRKVSMRASNVKDTWPGAELPAEIEKKLGTDDDPELEIIDCCYRDFATGKSYYEVVLKSPEKRLLKNPETYDGTPPWGLVYWTKMPDESFGRGPIVHALPDILTANKTVEILLKNASISMTGIWTATDDGVLNPNNVRLTPGTIIPVARNQGHPMGPSLAPLTPPGKFDLGQIVLADLQERIRRTLFDTRLPPDTGPVRSAYEISERIAATQMDIGAPFTRVYKELVVWLVHRGLQIMQRKKLIDYPVVIDGSTVDVEIVSPIARTRGMGEVKNVLAWLDMIAPLGPELVALTARVETIPHWIAEQLNVPPALIRPPAEKSALMQTVAMMMARQQQPPADQGPPPGDTGPENPVTAGAAPYGSDLDGAEGSVQ